MNVIDKFAFEIYRLVCQLKAAVMSLKRDRSLSEDLEYMSAQFQAQMKAEDYPPEALQYILRQMRMLLVMFVGFILLNMVLEKVFA